MANVLVPLAQGCEELEAVTVIDLTNANARAFYAAAGVNFEGFVFRDSEVTQGGYSGGALYLDEFALRGDGQTIGPVSAPPAPPPPPAPAMDDSVWPRMAGLREQNPQALAEPREALAVWLRRGVLVEQGG